MLETIGTLIKVADTVNKWQTGRSEKKDAAKLAIRYWGCVLTEARESIGSMIRARDVMPSADEREAEDWDGMLATPMISLTVYDAVLPELVRLTPIPTVLTHMAALSKDLRFLQHLFELDRTAGAFHGTDTTTTAVTHLLRTCDDNIEHFNELRAYFVAEGRSVFGDEWQSLEPAYLPDSIETESK